MVLAFLADEPLPDHALPMVGLGAFGPTLAAFAVAFWRRELRQVFGRWRTEPKWIVVGLLFPLVMHLPATLFEVALGGEATQFFCFPKAPDFIVELAPSSVVVAWIFEKGDRSMSVAFACHAGGHRDNVNLAPESEVRLRTLRVVMLALVAAPAARASSANPEAGGTGASPKAA